MHGGGGRCAGRCRESQRGKQGHAAGDLEGGETLLGPAGQVDVHGGAHARAQVGGAGVQVTVLLRHLGGGRGEEKKREEEKGGEDGERRRKRRNEKRMGKGYE